MAKATGPAKFLDGHARVSLFEEADDLLIGKSGLFHSRYSPKLADFVPSLWYGREGAGQYKRSWACDRGLLKNHIEPRWGKRYLDQITKADLITLFAEHRKTHAPGSCNRLLILLRYLFNLAIKWETPGITKNPTSGFPLMPEDNQKERFLTTDEAQVLYEKLKLSDNSMLQFIVPMLILTGARKREVLDARWQDFDFERRSWRIHTTKLGRPRHVPLSDGAVSLLNSMPRIASCEWAFPNPKTKKPYVSIHCAWDRARNQAGLKDFRLHDARHSFASFLVNSGRTLYEVQHLLGHTQIKTTARYSHLSQDTLLDASNAVTRAVGHLFIPLQTSSQAINATSSLLIPSIENSRGNLNGSQSNNDIVRGSL